MRATGTSAFYEGQEDDVREDEDDRVMGVSVVCTTVTGAFTAQSIHQ